MRMFPALSVVMMRTGKRFSLICRRSVIPVDEGSYVSR